MVSCFLKCVAFMGFGGQVCLARCLVCLKMCRFYEALRAGASREVLSVVSGVS